MSVAFRGGVKSPARECRARFRDGLVEVTWLQGRSSLGYTQKEMERYKGRKHTKELQENKSRWLVIMKGENTYVQRVVKSCGRSLRRFLQTRPKTIISEYLMLIEQYFLLI